TRVGSYVIAANFNCPGQIVVSGHADAVLRAGDLARVAGAKRVVPLSVSGAFHTALMQPAADRLATAIAGAEPFPAAAPVYANVTAQPYGKDELRRLLPLQITSPVLFETTIRNMMASGITHFLEIGPGSALSGFVRKISLDLPVARLDGPEDLANVKGWLNAHGFSE
ncbi:MAG: ACP S-malonyltransferase, partial [Bacillota bacterium]|nr:ACP S-malonyltransferase [Bacillota bacterium]